jgi:hypothetical protein
MDFLLLRIMDGVGWVGGLIVEVLFEIVQVLCLRVVSMNAMIPT